MKYVGATKLLVPSKVSFIIKKFRVCKNPILDILWIVDESRSIGYNNYLLVQQAIREVARNFTLGFNMTRMGVIEYDAEVYS